jgi:dienelactone hydrolase
MYKFTHEIIAGLASLACFAQAAISADTLPNINSFFGKEGIEYASISPSGQHIAISKRQQDGQSIVVIVDTMDPTKVKAVAGEKDDNSIPSLGWVNDNRIYYNIVDPDRGGFVGVANIDGSDQRLLSGFKRSTYSASGFWGTMHDGSEDIIASTSAYNVLGDLQNTHLYKINTASQPAKNWDVGLQPKHVTAWWLDRHDVPRIAISKLEGKCTTWYLAELPEKWEQLDQSECFDDHGFSPFFVESENNLYVTKIDDGFTKLYLYDLKNRKLANQPLIEFKGFDFSGYFHYDYTVGRVLGVHYDTDAKGTAWFDPIMKDIQKNIDKRLPTTINTIYCGSDCLNSPAVLFESVSDKQPKKFFIYKKSDQSIVGLGSSRPNIDPKQMGQRDFYRYKARDGMEIPVYVTRPAGPLQDHLPTVVIVHRGPWTRGASWEWENESQFLASRGYLVIQPEYRGGTGFGFAHFHAGFKQWGLAMQDDLTDAAQWAISKGWADPKRIAIQGGGYGGYAVLMGLIKTPNLFRCGVAFATETDLNELMDSPINDSSTDQKQYDLKTLVGDPIADQAMFQENSPLLHPELIKNPLLIAHGAQDRHFPISNTSSLVSKIKVHNPNVEWIVYANEGHGIVHNENLIDFYKHVEIFLDKNLKSAP